MLRGIDKTSAIRLLDIWKAAILKDEVYGFGLSKTLFWRAPLPRLTHDGFSLKAVFDNNPALDGQTIMGMKIISPDQIRQSLGSSGKIVVFAGDFQTVAQQLTSVGLREKYDFIRVSDFWSLWCYYKKGKIFNSRTMSLHLTDKCTLKCANCGARLPFWPKHHGDRPLNRVKRDFDLLFEHIDYLALLGPGSGESLMYKELPSLLDYIAERYLMRIGHMFLATNGTIIPEPMVLERCAAYGIEIYISDYSSADIPNYQQKLNSLMETLKRFGLRINLVNTPWVEYDLSAEQAQALALTGPEGLNRHSASCAMPCAFTADGFYYTCGRPYINKMSKVIDDDPELDALDLKKLDPSNEDDRLLTLMSCLDYYRLPALESCKICTGRKASQHNVARGSQHQGN